ncbi:unnamed protein product, partial [Onchocerca ochengi]|uniref:Secreted protein n=1 Tax=Onchocerca ochengi TaxID=42157 RepID=A0A182EJ90_ONCOC
SNWLTCITASIVRRMWLRLPSHADYHLFLSTSPVISLAHGTDCWGGGGKIQVVVTLYWLRQAALVV